MQILLGLTEICFLCLQGSRLRPGKLEDNVLFARRYTDDHQNSSTSKRVLRMRCQKQIGQGAVRQDQLKRQM